MSTQKPGKHRRPISEYTMEALAQHGIVLDEKGHWALAPLPDVVRDVLADKREAVKKLHEDEARAWRDDGVPSAECVRLNQELDEAREDLCEFSAVIGVCRKIECFNRLDSAPSAGLVCGECQQKNRDRVRELILERERGE